MTNQKQHPILANDTSSVWNFYRYFCSSDGISQVHKRWRREVSGVISVLLAKEGLKLSTSTTTTHDLQVF